MNLRNQKHILTIEIHLRKIGKQKLNGQVQSVYRTFIISVISIFYRVE